MEGKVSSGKAYHVSHNPFLAVQYGRAFGARVIGIDTGDRKKEFVKTLGAEAFIDFAKTADLVAEVQSLTGGLGAHAVVSTTGNPTALTQAADMLRCGGTLSCVGIPPGKTLVQTPVAGIAIKGLKISGNLIGSLRETMEALRYVREGQVKPHVEVRAFRELPTVYEELEKGDILGRVVLKVGDD